MRDVFRSGNRSQLPEVFHSEFLGVALRASLNGDASLFRGFWNACARDGWECPEAARVYTEYRLDDGRRIDMVIVDELNECILAVEVKTSESSTRSGQLEGYLSGLRKNYAEDKIAIAFLTPFNVGVAEERVGKDTAVLLPSVRVFEAFSLKFPTARHVSWLDVADMKWEGGELWKEYRVHIRKDMARRELLDGIVARDRTFDEFFGEDVAVAFWAELLRGNEQDAEGGVVLDLESFGREREPDEVAGAFTILINRGVGVVKAPRQKPCTEALRKKFLQSRHSAIHKALFDLADSFQNVWLEGGKNYGLRVAHRCDHGSVSLVTSREPGQLLIGQPR